jgi:hypothetical protein
MLRDRGSRKKGKSCNYILYFMKILYIHILYMHLRERFLAQKKDSWKKFRKYYREKKENKP